jgi:predicted RNA-binding protein associated with RNAse of E/G family
MGISCVAQNSWLVKKDSASWTYFLVHTFIHDVIKQTKEQTTAKPTRVVCYVCG